jgi:hypothetical protein
MKEGAGRMNSVVMRYSSMAASHLCLMEIINDNRFPAPVISGLNEGQIDLRRIISRKTPILWPAMGSI